jgi:undecaprenyl-diphosphatase
MHKYRSKTLFLITFFSLGIFCIVAFSVFLQNTSSQTPATIDTGSQSFLVTFDNAFEKVIQPFRYSNTIARFMVFATSLANPVVIIALQAVVLAVILILKRKRIAALFLGSVIAGELCSLFFKNILARVRPDEIFFHVARHGFSFPSGHALLATVFYGTLGFFLVHAVHKKSHKMFITCLTVFVIFLVGISRVYLGVHWISDVVGGWLLGGGVVGIVMILFSRWHRHQKNEKYLYFKPQELLLIITLALALGFFLVTYVVTHVSELRSIV